MLGLNQGGTTKKLTKEEEKLYIPKIYYKSFHVGSCKQNDAWPDCDVDCNIQKPGKGCSYNEYYSGNQTKKYYVCRKEQYWMYFLYCNGSYDLPLYSCYGK